jgi:hypothetical protein
MKSNLKFSEGDRGCLAFKILKKSKNRCPVRKDLKFVGFRDVLTCVFELNAVVFEV